MWCLQNVKQKKKSSDNSESARKTAPRGSSCEMTQRGPRIRRTACLNANAINAILYEVDVPELKRRKQIREKQEMKKGNNSGKKCYLFKSNLSLQISYACRLNVYVCKLSFENC